jgi:hypothetical protein
MKIDLRKIYRFDPVPQPAGEPLPRGGDIYYECGSCKEVVSSVPHIVVACACGNLTGSGGTTEIKAPDQVTPLRGKLK